MSTVLDKLKNKLKHKPVVHDFKPVEIVVVAANAPPTTKQKRGAILAANKVTVIDKRAENEVDRAAILANLQRNMLRHHIPTVYNEPVLDAEVHVATKKARAVVDDGDKPEKMKKAKKVVIVDEAADADAIDPDNMENIVQIEKVQNERITKAPVKGPVEIGPEILVKIGDTAIPERIPRKAPHVNIKVDSYYMNNREKFVNFINSIFEPYREELETKENISCDNLGGNTTGGLLTHQKIVRDYMNLYTPYRGLLIQHSLGSGKTATSIAIAEGMKSAKKVIVLTPASLRMNYVEELKRFGDELYRKNQYWEWVPTDRAASNSKATPQETAQTLAKVLNLPLEYVTRKKGAWFINVKKPANFGTLSAEDKKAVDDQLNEMIKSKYTFINYNGLRYSKLRELTADFTVNLFDNAVVIVDEAHNLISRVVNKIKMDPAFAKQKDGARATKKPKERPQPRFIATRLYEDLMSATNARVVLLSGTPIINYPNEFAILYNILRGYIKTWTFQLSIKTAEKVNADKLRDLLQTEKTLDYLDYSPSSKTMTLTRNPFGFRNVYQGQSYKGVATPPSLELGPYISDEQFEKNIARILGQHQIDVVQNSKQVTNYKALPDDFESFAEKFINPNTKELVNVNALKRRILGLTSYYKSAQLSLLPRYNKTLGEDYHILKIPMSDFQFGIYETARASEREVEKRARNPKKQSDKLEELYEQNTSTYRIFSRLYCNYVMLNRPMPTEEERKERIAKKNAKKEEQKGGYSDSGSDSDSSDSDSGSDNGSDSGSSDSGDSDNDEVIEGGAERCPPGTRRSKKTGECEPTAAAAVPVLAPAEPLPTVVEPVTKRAVRKKVVLAAAMADDNVADEAAADKVADELPMIVPPLKKGKAVPPKAMEEENMLAEAKREETDEDLEVNKEGEVEGDEVLENMGGVYYKEQIVQTMQRIEQNPDEYLSKTQLQKHSPKFLAMLENIQDPAYKGLHLVYSQFRTLEGIGIFSLVLEHNGFTRFRLSKNESTGQWKINMDEIRARGFPTYALYTGTESAEEKEVLRNIYNGDWDMVPTNLVADLKTMSANNNLGEVIKVFMITSSGSEGINLRNTRYVHVMEPYWHPVRVEQVIGRARRICSHKGLPEELRTVEVFIYLMVFSAEQLASDKSIELRLHDKGPLNPDAGPVTSDQYLFEVSEIKAVIARQLTQVSQESSFDCSIYNSGDAKGADGKELKCVNFANPDVDDFTYVPDYMKQENDATAQMNKRKVEWKAVPITISGIEYAARLVGPDKYEIYNFISYQKGNPVQVGTLEKIGGKMVFSPIVR